MAKKMPGRLVALSASAVATIYLGGLISTQPAAAGVTAAAATPVPAVSSAASATTTPSVVVGASSTLATTSTTSGAYANGTYSGTGTSKFGNVSVSVTVAAGKITNVQITGVTTSFPESRIASLPALVVANQSGNVNVVTGATYSSTAFRTAVQQALTQARAANSTASTG